MTRTKKHQQMTHKLSKKKYCMKERMMQCMHITGTTNGVGWGNEEMSKYFQRKKMIRIQYLIISLS